MKRISVVYLSLFASLGAVAAPKVELPPELVSCTNFCKCNQNVRNLFNRQFIESTKAGDMAKFVALADLLAKSPVDVQTFNLWNAGAGALVDAGIAQKKKTPTEQKQVMAGFREGGTTFGLWQGSGDEIKTPDQAFVAAAINLLKAKMPQKELTAEFQVRRDQSILGLQKKAGTEKASWAAADVLKGLAYAIVPTTPADTNAVLSAAKSFFDFQIEMGRFGQAADFAADFRTKRANLLSDKDKAIWLARQLGGYCRADNEKDFLALRDSFRKLPVGESMLEGILAFREIVSRCYPARWKDIGDFAKPLIDARARAFRGVQMLRVQELMYAIASGTGDVAGMKSAYNDLVALTADIENRWNAENEREKKAREQEKIARQNKQQVVPFVRNPEIERPNPWVLNNVRGCFIRDMVRYGEWAAVAPAMEVTLNPRNPNGYVDLIKAYASIGNAKRVHDLAAVLATNENAKADHQFQAAAIIAYVDAKDPASLRANLSKLRGDMDDVAWFNALRKAGRIYFNFDPSEKRVEWLKAVIAMSREMLWPEERVEYELTWLPDAPKSADGALRSDVFSRLKCENRMAVHNCYSLFSKDAEIKLLKSNPAPHLAADVEGKEAAVCAAYDANGLHVYMRFNDPEAWKARDGIANGFYCEYDFQPGGETPWHWNMVTRSDEANTDQGAVWDAPRKGFKVGSEYIREDAVSTENCHVFHIYIPWILCWNEFPKDGDVWRMVIVAGWAGQFGAMGGGSVHELGRALHLKFRLAPDARKAMLRGLLREAVRDYRKVRDKWENASFWVDADLGDPVFHEKVSDPFIKACDELAKECESADISDARAEEIFRTCLGDLADFRLALDKKRADYLKDGFFSKTVK